MNFIALANEASRLGDVLIEVGPVAHRFPGCSRDIFGDENACTPLAAECTRGGIQLLPRAVAFVNGVDGRLGHVLRRATRAPLWRPSSRVFLSNPAERPITVKSALSGGASSLFENIRDASLPGDCSSC